MACRPDRSDLNVSPEEAARIESEVRNYFDKITPKRPAKPDRSDPTGFDPNSVDMSSCDPHQIPEFNKLKELAANPMRLELDGGDEAEEYVMTGYYDELIGIDKQHHTTGTGFIKVENPNGSSFDVPTLSYQSESLVRTISNPATNDWIPSAEMVIPVSNKPNRSDA